MTWNVRGLLAVTIIATALSAGPARAADRPQRKTITTRTLQISAAPEPRFALQYRFETAYLDQEAGNAAFLYQTAVGQMMQTNSGDQAIDRDTLSQWYREPIESLPLEKVRRAIARFEQSFRLLETAIRRQRCTWEYPIRKGSIPYVSPLLNEYRTLSRLIAIRAKLEMHGGDMDAALKTMRMGISLARDVGAGPDYIQHLVGLGMAAGTVRQLEGWVQSPNAPNLYWALTTLPRPLVDVRPAIQTESQALLAEVPELRRLEDSVLSNEQVLDLWTRAASWAGYGDGRPGNVLDKSRDVATAMAQYPRAKAALLEQGYPVEKVEAWSPLYAIVVAQYRQFRAIRDLTFKWTYVPYAQARKGLREAELAASGAWKYSQGSMLTNPFVAALPAVKRIAFLDARLARDVAMLRCVEAIRMYAAEHGGKLPASLAEITAVPVPEDPFHGRAFRYEVNGKNAVLEGPVPPDGGPRDGLRYEITLR